ncbi:hypothetical protein [Streptomyces sp. NPDC048277]|uniref:hypothetical protein n=1 Tax=Streptomyces sp. NPDC048277 TaxID=3155027 RepID=UPI0033F48993
MWTRLTGSEWNLAPSIRPCTDTEDDERHEDQVRGLFVTGKSARPCYRALRTILIDRVDELIDDSLP